MATSKVALKSIKASIDAGDFEKAAFQAEDLTKQDEKNFNAFIFLGFAHDKLSHYDAAEKALKTALKLKAEDVQPFKGLITLYEKQGSAKVDQYHDVVSELAGIYAKQDDRNQCQNVIDKYEIFAKRNGSRPQYRQALELILPTSELYSTLEGRVLHPALAYRRILESAQAEEKEWTNTQIGERRTRLGSKIDQVSQQVKAEAITKFQIEEKYQYLIDWTQDDEVRHQLDQELLQRMFDNLLVVPAELKPEQRDKVLNKANGMVVIKQMFPLAWKLALEWVDAEDLADWDVGILREYVEYFPDDGLAKVLRGFLDSDTSPFPDLKIESDEEADVPVKLSEADQLIIMSQGLEDCPESMLAHRIMAHTYSGMKEHESAVEMARKAQKLYLQAQTSYALELQDSIDAVNLTLSTSLITYQSPRHHPEARALFEAILARKPLLTAALLGVGLVLEEDEDYSEAVKFLEKASERDPANIRIRLEYAWCHALNGELEAGLAELEGVLDRIEEEKTKNLPMKSEALYRVAYCMWHINTSVSARKDKAGPYRYLIDSLKANPSYAPSYTLLGIYFQDYSKSKTRARNALQKAFELSSSELTAAERLAKAFANTGEWDLVELVAQRVVESGKARPAPGSKKKAFSWPYAALGVVQMNKSQYTQSIVSFQHALRISPNDYHSWVGLGESYHNAGRYIAASRAFARAESIDHGLSPEQSWFAKYMLANVQREMGAFEDAINAFEAVLEIKKDEFGVLIALLQTLTESAWTKLAQGHFGDAVRLGRKAIGTAKSIVSQRTEVFNLWKSVGDACSIFSIAKQFAGEVDIQILASLLQQDLNPDALKVLDNVDRVNIESLQSGEDASPSEAADECHIASIIAHKRAIHASSNDTHAQAVSWFNLGWAEYNAYSLAGSLLMAKGKRPRHLLKASMRCFKRAIELEAGNSEFWNALGVVTMNLNPSVSQHSFVRSLHLNDTSARTWTNLGVLYLINNENELANEAFTRAQSADPEYASAWVGQGLLAALFGNFKEARGLFTHAFEIADSTSTPASQHYAVSSFDYLIRDPSVSREITNLLQPLLALRQLRTQAPTDITTSHLLSLFAERVSEHGDAASSLENVCAIAEGEYEKSESNEYLSRFAQAQADLARARLGEGQYSEAIEAAQTALDLSSEDDLGPAYDEQRLKWRLSAHITAGLAHSHLKDMQQSINMFQAALDDSKGEPDVVCMLAQVLWAQGGEQGKDNARSQLFSCVERHPNHVQAVSLLAMIGLLDDDVDVLEAVEDDLKALRVSDKVNISQKLKVAKVLSGIISCKPDGNTDEAIADALSGVMLSPTQPQGWLELSRLSGDQYASEMALQSAIKQILPGGSLGAEDLARAYAGTGKVENFCLAVMIAPWLEDDVSNGVELTA